MDAQAPGDLAPPRVRIAEALCRERQKSEVLIGALQLSIVILFGVLYTLSPKTYPPDVTFQPVPLALGLYLGFTLGRLWLAARRPLPGWLVALSVVVDMALLMVTIWSFHIQYEQPASFYLKAPTVMYLFIFIALRALRFEARYVVLAGGAAVLGWSAMVAYVILADSSDPMITRDYVAYLTSNSVLLGAEFDKIVTILMVTLILALVLRKARGVMETAVQVTETSRSLARFFPAQVAERIAAGDADVRPGRGVKRDAAILMLDLRGFTALARQQDADSTIALLAEYQSRMGPLIRRHGGVIDKFQGDGILATFGAVEANRTHAADALRALDEAMDEADSWNAWRSTRGLPPLQVGGGVVAGTVVFGIVGDPQRLEATVIGSAVNLAAKLEKHTKNEEARALTTCETLDIARRQGYTPRDGIERRPGRAVEGWSDRLDLAIFR